MDEDELERIFRTRVLRSPGLARARPAHDPTVVFAAGAPGAGKSTRLTEIRTAVELTARTVAVIDADDFRKYDPDYRRLQRIDPRSAADARHHVAARWADLAIGHAIRSRWSAVVSCTLGSAAVAEEKIGRFLAAGYRVFVAFGTTHEALSRLGILRRFYTALDDGDANVRFVPSDVHRACYDGLLGTASWLDAQVDRGVPIGSLVWSREKEPELVDGGVWSRLIWERDMPWVRSTIVDFLEDAERVEAFLRKVEREAAADDLLELGRLTRTLVTAHACVPRHGRQAPPVPVAAPLPGPTGPGAG